MQDSHAHYLKHALKIAQKRKGFCAPNPAVGAVVVKDNRIIATGLHWAAGKPHAEVDALQKLSAEAAKGSTVYVSLEPCCHHGKTPPCTQLLIQRQVSAVYYGFIDPNPKVLGQGKQELAAAGIQCTHLPSAAIDAFYQSYAYWTHTKLPWVTAKLAMSLDGKIAGPGGARVAITGEKARIFTHRCRQQSDAILTTVRTVIRDNPQLNIRLTGQKAQQKPIYILDKNLDFPIQCQLVKTAQKITLFHQESVDNARRLFLESQGIDCVPIDIKQNKINPASILKYLGQAGIQDLFIEAGGICFETWICQKKVQRAFVYVAPKWLGPEAQSAFDHPTTIFNTMRQLKSCALGEDWLLEFCSD
jgi:diaminohydroxyphosphoribosylaminopyrimidine deaminase/5-amino-6-(5-phosphoribosylamino)uracil reductase